MKRLTPAIVAILFGIACVGTAQGWGIRYASGPDPAVSRWPSWPHPTGCLGVTFDPVAVFSGPTEAEKGAGGPELALRRYLDEGLYPQLPTKFWRLVAATDTRAYFASGLLKQGLFWLAFELVEGQWLPAGELEECRPRTEREGRAATTWRLAEGKLGPRSRSIRVQLTDDPGCHGFIEARSRAEAPEFQRVGRKLILRIWLEQLPPGIYTCPKARNRPLLVQLPGPLGRRQLWDGGTYPPKRRR